MAKVVYVFGSSLMHHGKRGQKWGVRNGPPYPLDKDGKERLRKQRMESYGKDKTGMSAFLSQRENERDVKIKTYNSKTNGSEILSPKDGTYRLDKSSPRSWEDACVDANSLRIKYPNQVQWQNNCVNASTSLINQRKGFYTGAGPNADGVANEAIGYYFDGAYRETPNSDDVRKTILNHGPGSYGIMNTYTNNDNGHAVVWEVDSNNKINIHDGQVNKHYTFDEYETKVGINPWSGTSIYDLTNATPNFEHQFEDHSVYPLNSGLTDYSYTTQWNEKSRIYNGPTKDSTTYISRMEGYGLK